MAHLPPVANAPKLLNPDKLPPFVDPLPLPPVAKAAGLKPSPSNPKKQIPCYRMPIHEFFAKIHRDVPATRFWGYGDSMPGPTIEARSGEEILVEWQNNLPVKHFLPIDHNLMGAEKDQPEVRTVVHVHGAKVPPASDGYPEDWYVPGGSKVYHYPNQQDAALLWYHDHAMGINRLNICAGMLGLYTIRDLFEDGLNLPKGEFEIPLILTDRLIRADGQLYYPVSQRLEAPWLPEYFGDAILINGKLLPYLEVQPRKYRFRVLNASNGRFYFLSLANGPAFQHIGSDQGLLASPQKARQLTLSPGERIDLVLDFTDHAGEEILLNNQSVQMMQFRVAKGKAEDSSSLPARLRDVPRTPESAAIRTRRLTLDQVDYLTGEPDVHLLDGKRWHEPISEKPVLDTTEIWELMNVTDDSHPIHLHLVRFQLLDRRPLNVGLHLYENKLSYTGDAAPPEPHEMGWKDTIRATPGACTRIIVKFEGYTGRYVWHCHILEHEDNEMMRPYEVVAPAKT
ncbi:MAG TPA: multicopper oxidase [Bryobacteraceae bacterium]|nr:multicopper oxidase [Bryobacteraceae bacterium]